MRSEADTARIVVEQLISLWREQFSSLSSAEQSTVSGTLDDFQDPCQVLVIWLRNSKLQVDHQLWVITHFSDRPDLEIVVHDPIETEEAISKLVIVLDDPRLNRSLPQQKFFFGIDTYRSLVEPQLLALIRDIRAHMLQMVWAGPSSDRVGPMTKQRMSDEAFTWMVHGAPTNMDIDRIVAPIIQDLKARALNAAKASTVAPAKELHNEGNVGSSRRRGFGTYIYPHVWIGDRPVVPFEEQARVAAFDAGANLNVLRHQSVVMFKNIGDSYVIARQNGFIGVTVEDRSEALRFINLFMAMATASGVPALAVKDGELHSLVVDVASSQIVNSSGALTLPRMLPSYLPANFPTINLDLREPLSLAKLGELWSNTFAVIGNRDITSLFILFGEIYTHFQNEAYSETVLFASIWIEQWSALQATEGDPGSEYHRQGRGFLAAILGAGETLQRARETEPNIEANLKDLLGIRNQVAHGFTQATKSQAEFALSQVATLLATTQISEQ